MTNSFLTIRKGNINSLKNLDDKSHNKIFSSFSWIITWLNTYKIELGNVNLYTIYSNNELVALAPFYLQKTEGLLKLTTLYPLGQGEPERSEIASEYNDIYILEGYETEVLHILSKELKKLKIDQIKWRASLKDSHINRLLKATFHYQPTPTHARYLIERSTWSLDNLSKNTRSRYKRSLNQLTDINASFKWVGKNDYEHFSQILAQFHQTRWNNKGCAGAFAEKDFQSFHKSYRATNPCNIKISAIMVNNKPIAINYYLADESTLYFYQCGWDERNYANLSPGFALHLWSIEHCNFEWYDFMMGGLNDSYKAKFGSKKISMVNNHVIINKRKYNFHRLINKLLNYFN